MLFCLHASHSFPLFVLIVSPRLCSKMSHHSLACRSQFPLRLRSCLSLVSPTAVLYRGVYTYTIGRACRGTFVDLSHAWSYSAADQLVCLSGKYRGNLCTELRFSHEVSDTVTRLYSFASINSALAEPINAWTVHGSLRSLLTCQWALSDSGAQLLGSVVDGHTVVSEWFYNAFQQQRSKVLRDQIKRPCRSSPRV